MASKLVTDRQRAAAFVEAAVEMQGGAAAAAVEEDLRLLMEDGEAPPMVFELLRLLARKLQRARQTLVAADEAHLLELDDDAEPRRWRDAVAQEVYLAVSRLRAVFRGMYGIQVASELLGVEGRTAEDPLLLHRQAARIVQRFTAPDFRLPDGVLAGVGMEPEACVAQLLPGVQRLRAALDEVNRQRKAAEATLKAKTEARRSFDHTYQGVAKTVEGLFGLGGFDELARRVRPTRRKATRPQQTDAEPAAFSVQLPPLPKVASLTLLPPLPS